MASKLRLQIAPEKRPGTWNPEKALADALAERALFLENYPKYQAFQKEINKMLDKAGNPENRMAVLAVLMEAKLLELHQQLKQLNGILIRAIAQEQPQNRVSRFISSN
jgi:hypothetical protein